MCSGWCEKPICYWRYIDTGFYSISLHISASKVIYPKYYKHWLYTLLYTLLSIWPEKYYIHSDSYFLFVLFIKIWKKWPLKLRYFRNIFCTGPKNRKYKIHLSFYSSTWDIYLGNFVCKPKELLFLRAFLWCRCLLICIIHK